MSGDDVGRSELPTSKFAQSKAIRPNNNPVWGCCAESTTLDADMMNEQEEQIEGFGEELEEGAGDSADDDEDPEDGDRDEDCEGPHCDDAKAKRDPGDEAKGNPGVNPGKTPELGEEEVKLPQVASQPHLPIRDEQDTHEAMGHAQYQRWCEPCVHGQGREDRHLRNAKHRSLPVVSYDYGFLTEQDEEYVRLGRKQLSQVTRLLIGRDSRSRMIFAHVIPHKGIHHGS